MFFLVMVMWISFAVATAIIAARKNLSIAVYVVLAIFLGPLALLLVAFENRQSPEKELPGKLRSFRDVLVELGRIKSEFSSLRAKMDRLEEDIKRLSGREELAAEPYATEKAIPAEGKTLESRPREGFEFIFGKYWLNRIGVVIFFLGLAFFISYTFRYLNALAKIAIGYFFSTVFFVWGNFLERKKKYVRLSWGILGGGWGILYLATYAMYYLEATRLIANPLIELCLLAVVSFAAIVYNLKYRSWVVTAIASLLAFITAGLGGIDYSTIIYCILLIASIVYLAYRFNWYEFLLFGICGAYLVYGFWLFPNIMNAFLVSRKFSVSIYQFQLIFSILAISWILFSAGLSFLQVENKSRLRFVVAGILLNAIFFVILGLEELYRVRHSLEVIWDIRFWFLITLSIIYLLFAYLYKLSQRPKLIVSSISIAFTLLAMASIIKFPKLSVGFFWLLETAILFTLGVYYKEVVYRILSGVLNFMIMLRLFAVDYTTEKTYALMGIDIKHNVLIFIFATVCFYLVGALSRIEGIKKILKEGEEQFFELFIGAGTLLITFLFGKEIAIKWLSLSWAILALFILGLGFWLKQRMFRICSLCVFSLACLRLILFDLAGINTIYKITGFIFLGAILLGASLVYAKFLSRETKR